MRCGAAVSRTVSRVSGGYSGSFKGETTMQNKSIFTAALAALLVAAVVKSATAQQPTMAPPPLQIKAGISDPVNTVLAWYMARAAGLYSAQGLNVEIINMNGGSRGAE